MTLTYLICQLIIFLLYYESINYQFFILGATIREILYLWGIIASSFLLHQVSQKYRLLTPYRVYLRYTVWLLTLGIAISLVIFSPWQFVSPASRGWPSASASIIQPWYFIMMSVILLLTAIQTIVLSKQKQRDPKQWLIILSPLILSASFLVLLYVFKSSWPIYNG